MPLPTNLASLTEEELKRLYELCELDLAEMECVGAHMRRNIMRVFWDINAEELERQLKSMADCIARKRGQLAAIQRAANLKAAVTVNPVDLTRFDSNPF